MLTNGSALYYNLKTCRHFAYNKNMKDHDRVLLAVFTSIVGAVFMMYGVHSIGLIALFFGMYLIEKK